MSISHEEWCKARNLRSQMCNLRLVRGHLLLKSNLGATLLLHLLAITFSLGPFSAPC